MSEVNEEKNKVESEDEEIGAGVEFLLPRDSLLSAGIHIGTRIKTKDIHSFIYKVRHDGLFVLDIKKTDERIRVAAKFLSRFDPSRVVLASSRIYSHTPVQKFCDLTHTTPIIGRFPPGILSNPSHSNYIEADVVVLTDSKADSQAVKEAASIGIPVIALCDTDNDFQDIDFAIPTNNKGRRALATIYWLLARQLLIEKGALPQGSDLPLKIDDFETKLEASEVPDSEE